MNKNLGNKDNNYDDYDKCVLIACKKFEEKHPKEEQPEWLKYCMSMKVNRNQYKNWVIKLILQPKPKLRSNEY